MPAGGAAVKAEPPGGTPPRRRLPAGENFEGDDAAVLALVISLNADFHRVNRPHCPLLA
jgi:hypothetical protein